MTNITPNKGQMQVIEEGIRVIKSGSKQVFQFAGNPGTGKSFVLAEIIKRSGINPDKVAPMAYTGTAANVMRKKGLLNAKTIHSTLYEAVETVLLDKAGNPIMDTYLNKPKKVLKFVPKPTPDIELFVIDEGSMVPWHMRQEIESRGIPVIVTGDLDQLPPVGDKPAYLIGDDVMVLTEIMRQALNSPIIYLSQRAKYGLPIHCGLYGNYYNQEVLVIERNQVTPEMLLNSQVILCSKNKTRDNLNREVRSLKGYSGMLPRFGEKLICRKNNYDKQVEDITLANGLMGYVISEPDVSGLNKDHTFRLDFQPFITHRPFTDLYADFKYFNGDAETRRMIKDDYMGYHPGEKFELAYAITVHASQGSQYDCGMYFEEYLGGGTEVQRKLNYTAISRFAKRMIYVKEPVKKFF